MCPNVEGTEGSSVAGRGVERFGAIFGRLRPKRTSAVPAWHTHTHTHTHARFVCAKGWGRRTRIFFAYILCLHFLPKKLPAFFKALVEGPDE